MGTTTNGVIAIGAVALSMYAVFRVFVHSLGKVAAVQHRVHMEQNKAAIDGKPHW